MEKEELEDQDQLKPQDLPQILAKNPPVYLIRNYEDFYSKSRIICQNSFNLEFDEQVDYFTRFLNEFDQSQNRSVFVKRYMQVTLERSSDEDIETACSVLTTLFLNHVFTKQQLRRGFDRLYMDAENIIEDVPNLHQHMAKFVLNLVEQDVLNRQILIKIPPHEREEMSQYAPFSEFFGEELKIFDKELEIKEKFAQLAMSFQKTFDTQEVIDQLK